MDPDSFLAFHNSGLGRLLGFEFLSADKERVVSRMPIRPEHLTRPDVVHGGIVMAMADATSAYGAVLNLPPNHTTATIESKTNFLKKGSGDVLRVESTPLHVGSTTSVWRASVFRGTDRIAEVTQTQIVLAEREPQRQPGVEEAAPTAVVTPLPVRDGRTQASRNFTQDVVDHRKRQILDAACRVISANGFGKATMRQIAQEAGMPIATMYQYIERKEDLLQEIYKFFMGEIADELRRCLALDLPPEEKVARAISMMVDKFDESHRYIKIMFRESPALPPEARQEVYRLDASYIALIRQLVDDATEHGGGHTENSEIAANLIYFLTVIWPLRHWTLHRFGKEAVSRAIIDLVLTGIAAPQQQADAVLKRIRGTSP